MGERVRGFHRDDRGQIIPLVFFFAIAFLTGVILVIDTGRSVNDRIDTQNAVDAANISGVTTIARGMNYVARNNIAQSKILASIVIVRAIKPAVAAAFAALLVWDGVAVALDLAAAAAAGSVVAAPAAPALKAAASAIRWKVKQERAVLKVVKKAGETLNKIWTKQTEDKGPAWTVLQALAPFGKALMYMTPVLAQTTAKIVFQKNVPGGKSDPGLLDLVNVQKPDVWLIPLFPNIPACQGKFTEFASPTTYYTGYYAKPIYVFGWLALTLSLFPVSYKLSINASLKQLFKGGDVDPIENNDPDSKRLKELDSELTTLEGEVNYLNQERDKKAKEKEDKEKLRDQKIAERNRYASDSDEYKKLDKEIKELEKEIAELEKEIEELDKEIKEKTDRMEEINKEIQEIQERRMNNTGPPDDWSNESENPLQGGGSGRTDLDKKIYPFLLDGREYPKSFSYFALGWQKVRKPLGGDVLFERKIPYGFAYAAAQLYNPTHADLWTADWRAKLVRAYPSLLRNPIGAPVKTCAGDSTGEGGGSQTNNSLGGDNSETADKSRSMLDQIIGIVSKH